MTPYLIALALLAAYSVVALFTYRCMGWSFLGRAWSVLFSLAWPLLLVVFVGTWLKGRVSR